MTGTWHYAAGHRKLASGEDWYDVREVYPGLGEGDGPAYTENAMAPGGETKDELLKVLVMMLIDVCRKDVIEVGE